MKYYKDSKEFPLFNYIRIVDTKDFFYVIKGYDGEAIEGADIKECEEKFNEIVKDFVSETNNYNKKVTMLSKIEKMKIQIINLSLLTDFLSLIENYNKLAEKNGLPYLKQEYEELIQGFKIQKKDNISSQKDIIQSKVNFYIRQINELSDKITKDNLEEEEIDINEVVINVALSLETVIDVEKTTLYQFGIYQKLAIKKAEQLNKKSNGK